MSEKIKVTCPSCSNSMAVPREYLGKNGKCPKCKNVFTVYADAQPLPPEPKDTRRPTEQEKVQVAKTIVAQPTHQEEFSRDRQRVLEAVSFAPDKYDLIVPYLMEYETPVAMAIQRQFPFSLFADIVLLSSHRLMVFKRFFSKIDMFDVNYVDIHDVTVRQGFFTSTLTIRTVHGRTCIATKLITDQALNIYRRCQDIETKARVARRQHQLEENRSRTTQFQVNNLVAPQPQAPLYPHQQALPGYGAVNPGDEERNPYRAGE